MKIPANQIETKDIAGKTKDGRPVVYIATKGGLHAFFCKDKDDNIASIGAAPHKAIAKFLASKKEDIEWNKDFGTDTNSLGKTESALFAKLRKAMFVPSLLVNINNTDAFLIYDTDKLNISIMTKTEVEAGIQSNQLDKYDLVRSVSLSSPAVPLVKHDYFGPLFKESL